MELGQFGCALLEFTQGGFGPLDLRLGLVVFFLALPGPLLGCFRLVLGLCRLSARRRVAVLASGLGGGGVGAFELRRWRASARAARGAICTGRCLGGRGEADGRNEGFDEPARGPLLGRRRVRQSCTGKIDRAALLRRL
ncbi:hypothetical protein [Streptomyces sp. NPDC006355]|uniref:hypothetical protein n=1 Tax=Streptomyces sp. NPDC006355 TaxID=3156758 RepID=UPI0033B84984